MSMSSQVLMSSCPRVSIGMPVYNCAQTIMSALESALNQSFEDFELIISDNGSTDSTAEICMAYEKRDKRIRYIRQPCNLGPAANFRFLVDVAKAPYFLWAACDDIRSPDFLEENVRFLDTHLDYVSSTSPNCMQGQDPGGPHIVKFEMVGNVEERFRMFFENAWVSHGIFYSLARTNVLRDCDVLGEQFLGVDWAINLYMASRGKIGRIERGFTIFGTGGLSKGPKAWSAFRSHPIGWAFPFYEFSTFTYKLASSFSSRGRIRLIKHLIGLNIKSAVFQLLSEIIYIFKQKIELFKRI